MVADPASFFSVLKAARRVWAVGAIHGEAGRLRALHAVLEQRLQPGDRIVYLGNYLGWGPDIQGTQEELLRQRIAWLARPGMFAADVAYLRGAQEEMWRKLLQLQFAPNPREVLEWMLGQGVAATLQSYGHDPKDVRIACREGALALTKWANQVRSSLHARPGHDELLAALRRAAYTEQSELLFVAAGVDPERPLSQQGDVFWWGTGYFGRIEAYEGFRRIIRGYDRARRGLDLERYAVTLDGGCGFGGTLNAACFQLDGSLADWVEA